VKIVGAQSGKTVENAYLTATFEAHRLEVRFRAVVAEDVTLSGRKPRWQRILRHELRNVGATFQEAMGERLVYNFPAGTEERVRRVIVQLSRSIETDLGRPLTGRMVEKLLKITKQERLSWGALGRLGRLPSARVQRGHSVQVQTYSAGAIANLVKNPYLIDSWRRRDAESDSDAPLKAPFEG
jgi:hypothetical protein